MSSEGDAGNVGGPRLDETKAEMFSSESQRMAVSQLPEPLKKRLRALKQLQAETALLEAKFFRDVHAMECHYHNEYSKLNNKRNEIVQGDYEPSEEELYPGDPFPVIQGELAVKLTKELKLESSGIPDFWLTIFKNVNMLNDTVYPNDLPILEHLLDVRCALNEEPMGFELEFHFSINEYFKNRVLVKEYFMKCTPDDDDPFSFEGPEIYKSRGCTIDWFNGKNVTVKTVKKRQKHKSRGQTRTVTKQVQADSFFNFFSPPEIPDDPNAELDEETQSLLSADFELGHYIRERIVPHAVLYYTGELLDDEYDDDTTSESSEGDASPGSEESQSSGTKSQETEEGEQEEGTQNS